MSPGEQYWSSSHAVIRPAASGGGSCPRLEHIPKRRFLNRSLFSLGPARELFFTMVISSCTFHHLVLALLSETIPMMSQNIYLVFCFLGGEREKGRENLKLALHPAWSPTRGSILWPKDHDLGWKQESDTSLTEPHSHPQNIYLQTMIILHIFGNGKFVSVICCPPFLWPHPTGPVSWLHSLLQKQGSQHMAEGGC